MVRRLLRTHRVVCSAVLGVELVSAIRRRRAEHAISAVSFARLRKRIDADAEKWDLLTVSDDVLARARACVLRSGVRTLDAIHIASAETVYQAGLRLPFVTADAREADGARAAGLEVIEVGR